MLSLLLFIVITTGDVKCLILKSKLITWVTSQKAIMQISETERVIFDVWRNEWIWKPGLFFQYGITNNETNCLTISKLYNSEQIYE